MPKSPATRLLEGLYAQLEYGTLFLMDTSCSGSPTTRGHLRKALDIPHYQDGVPQPLSNKRFIRLWDASVSAEARISAKALGPAFPPVISTSNNSAEFEMSGPDDPTTYDTMEITPDIGPVVVRLRGRHDGLMGTVLVTFLWEGNPETPTLERVLQTLNSELESLASQQVDLATQKERLCDVILQTPLVDEAEVIHLRNAASVGKDTNESHDQQWETIVSSLFAIVRVQVQGKSFWLGLQTVVNPAPSLAKMMPTCICVPNARPPHLFRLFILGLYGLIKNPNPYNLNSGDGDFTDASDMPSASKKSSKKLYVKYVVHWENLVSEFQAETGLRDEAFTIMMFHSKGGYNNRECIRFCRLVEFFQHWLMSRRTYRSNIINPLLKWIANNCPSYNMSDNEIIDWCADTENEDMRSYANWDDEVDGDALHNALQAAAQLCDVTIPEMAHLWINWQHFAKPIFNHPLIGNLKRCKQQPPVVEFMHGLYLLESGRVLPSWGRDRFSGVLDANRSTIIDKLKQTIEELERPQLNWQKVVDRELGKAFLNDLAQSSDPLWEDLNIQKDAWVRWRDTLLSPPWSSEYPANQPDLLKAFRKRARDHFSDHSPPSDHKLNTLLDTLAVEVMATAAGAITSSDKVWRPREVAAIALVMWVYRVSPELDEQGERARMPLGITWAAQTLLPLRTTNTIQNVIFRRHPQIASVYFAFLRTIDERGLAFLKDLLPSELYDLLLEAGCETEAHEYVNRGIVAQPAQPAAEEAEVAEEAEEEDEPDE